MMIVSGHSVLRACLCIAQFCWHCVHPFCCSTSISRHVNVRLDVMDGERIARNCRFGKSCARQTR